MAARIGHLALAAMLISLTGCAMCVDSFDCRYAAYGGRLPRTDMVNGRVGSILDPAGGRDETGDVLLEDGCIKAVEPHIEAPAARVIDVSGKWVTAPATSSSKLGQPQWLSNLSLASYSTALQRRQR